MLFGSKKDGDFDFEYFTIFDSKVGVYREPALALNRHDAVRQLTDMMRDPRQAQNSLVLNAEDYSIFKIGDWSKRTGVIRYHTPEHVANLHDIRAMVQRELSSRPLAPKDEQVIPIQAQ